MNTYLFNLLSLVTLLFNTDEPQLQGGISNFLKANTIYPRYSRQHCIQGTVQVGFKINQKGEVYYATVTNGLGTDLDEEALRLIKLSSGKWTVSPKHDTLALVTIPMSFSLRDDECRLRDKGSIALAIRAYQLEMDAQTIITNFYKAKEQGIADPAEEQKIEKLKEELGIDDEFLESKISTGLKKIKQGDKEGACADFNFVKYMGSDRANDLLQKYCK